MAKANGERVFPRYGPHVSWQQRWYSGTANKAVLRKREQPMPMKELDHEGAMVRVLAFRSSFYECQSYTIEQLRRGRQR